MADYTDKNAPAPFSGDTAASDGGASNDPDGVSGSNPQDSSNDPQDSDTTPAPKPAGGLALTPGVRLGDVLDAQDGTPTVAAFLASHGDVDPAALLDDAGIIRPNPDSDDGSWAL